MEEVKDVREEDSAALRVSGDAQLERVRRHELQRNTQIALSFLAARLERSDNSEKIKQKVKRRGRPAAFDFLLVEYKLKRAV